VRDIVQAGVSGDPGLLEAAKARREFGVQQRTAASQYDASNLYDAMDAVTDAAPGQALFTLQGIAPRTAAMIKQQIPDGADEDAAARAYADHVAGSVHMYTGRKVEARPDGTYVDSTTGKPVPGVEKNGLSEQQWADLAKAGTAPTTWKDSDGAEHNGPTYLAPGQPGGGKLDQWVMRHAARAGAPGAQPTVSGAPAATANKQAKAAAETALKTTAPTSSTPPPAPVGQTPTEAGALADKSFRDPAAPGQTPPQQGVGPGNVQKGLQDTYVAQRKEAQDEYSNNAASASQALLNFNAAKQILGAPDGSHLNAMSGIPGAILGELGRLGYDTDTADHRVEAAKYLTNAAVANIKNTYGSKPGVFDVKVNLEKAFPSIEGMPINAARQLVDSQINQAAYIRDSAARGSRYLAVGNSPSRFNEYNEQYFPRSAILKQSGQQGPAGSQTVRVKMSDGRTGTIPAASLAKYKAMGAQVLQ
jgi:hypothetical protein